MPYTSMPKTTIEKKEPCSLCCERPSEVTCQCGQRFDFQCIARHQEQINAEYKMHHQKTGEQLVHLNDLRNQSSGQSARAANIDQWKRRWIEHIEEIARNAKSQIPDHHSSSDSSSELINDFNSLDDQKGLTVHDKLSLILDLSKQVEEQYEELRSNTQSDDVQKSLDAELQKRFASSGASGFSMVRREELTNNFRAEPPSPRIQPTLRLQTNSEESPVRPQASFVEPPVRHQAPRDEPSVRSETPREEPSVRSPSSLFGNPNPPQAPLTEHLMRQQPPPAELPVQFEPEIRMSSPFEMVNSTNGHSQYSSISSGPTMTGELVRDSLAAFAPPVVSEPVPVDDDFDLGLTDRIDRRNAIDIDASNDRFAGTVCCHGNQLVYVDYDEKSRKSNIVYIPNILVPNDRKLIPLDGTTTMDVQEEDWIRDIVYSEPAKNFILVKRTSLQQFNNDRTALEVYQSLPHSILTRITCDDHYLYVVSTAPRTSMNGDQIHLFSHEKETIAQKSFRDIIPNRMNRGGVLIGGIIDIAAGDNDGLLAMTYRVDRRREIGICLFNIKNNGRDWSSVKQLFLNECWNDRIVHTPRIDWSEKFKTFILVEYLTGHLLLIAKDAEVVGECRHVYGDQQHGSHPINVSTPDNGWLCTRFESAINIRQIK